LRRAYDLAVAIFFEVVAVVGSHEFLEEAVPEFA
jgi:hypothetical protein